MELPRRARGSRASALARVSRARQTVAHRPRAYLFFAADALPRREWYRHLDFQHVSSLLLGEFSFFLGKFMRLYERCTTVVK